jgi:hypothetical protein
MKKSGYAERNGSEGTSTRYKAHGYEPSLRNRTSWSSTPSRESRTPSIPAKNGWRRLKPPTRRLVSAPVIVPPMAYKVGDADGDLAAMEKPRRPRDAPEAAILTSKRSRILHSTRDGASDLPVRAAGSGATVLKRAKQNLFDCQCVPRSEGRWR